MIVDEVVETIKESWDTESRVAFIACAKKDLVKYHMSLGRAIRNNYDLWSIPWEPVLEKYGNIEVDCSPYHPDQLSDTIIEKVWVKLNEKPLNLLKEINDKHSKQLLAYAKLDNKPLTFWQQIKRLFTKWV